MVGQLLKEGPATTEQDRDLVEHHLVDQPRLQRSSQRPPPITPTSLPSAAPRAAATASSMPVVTSICCSLTCAGR